MVARRDVVGGTLFTGLAALVTPKAAAEQREAGETEVARAIDRLREVLEQQASGCALGQCTTVATIRTQQKTFLRANRKFPDFIDVGIDSWDAVHDWHVKNRQQLRSSRLPDGRYGIVFMFTTIVLREDQTPNYVGWGYDAR